MQGCFADQRVVHRYQVHGDLNQHGYHGTLQRQAVPSGIWLVGYILILWQDSNPKNSEKLLKAIWLRRKVKDNTTNSLRYTIVPTDPCKLFVIVALVQATPLATVLCGEVGGPGGSVEREHSYRAAVFKTHPFPEETAVTKLTVYENTAAHGARGLGGRTAPPEELEDTRQPVGSPSPASRSCSWPISDLIPSRHSGGGANRFPGRHACGQAPAGEALGLIEVEVLVRDDAFEAQEVLHAAQLAGRVADQPLPAHEQDLAHGEELQPVVQVLGVDADLHGAPGGVDQARAPVFEGQALEGGDVGLLGQRLRVVGDGSRHGVPDHHDQLGVSGHGIDTSRSLPGHK
ncbi:hypothetical protein Z043_115457, partial [Scleropages formosus]